MLPAPRRLAPLLVLAALGVTACSSASAPTPSSASAAAANAPAAAGSATSGASPSATSSPGASAAAAPTTARPSPSRTSAKPAARGDLGPLASPGVLFPAGNPWNTRVDTLPVAADSATIVASIGATRYLHPDFGAHWNGGPFGFPYVVVPGTQPKVRITFGYADESDPGPYPIPPNAPIEGGAASDGDRHVIVVDRDHRRLYEIGNAYRQPDGSWKAGAGAVFDLTSGRLRPAGWTSSDAAGLPILPGLVRYDEVAAGRIPHALRFTVAHTRKAYVSPARHWASSSTDPALPPMGLRLRLKTSFDVSGYPPQARVVLVALQRYGMFVADNGSDWYLSGTADPRWDDGQLDALKKVPGSAFEVVTTGPVTAG